MTLGKGLPVRTPSCLCGCDEVVWGLHSPTSAAFFDIPQASSSRPTDSLPGQPVRTVVTDLCLQATLWVSGLCETFSSEPPKAGRVLGSLPHPKAQDPQPVACSSGKAGREPRLFSGLLRRWAKRALTHPSRFHVVNLPSDENGRCWLEFFPG